MRANIDILELHLAYIVGGDYCVTVAAAREHVLTSRRRFLVGGLLLLVSLLGLEFIHALSTTEQIFIDGVVI